MNLFEIENGQLVVSTPVILAVPEFAAIMRKRYMNYPGDHDNRDKQMNIRLLMYIFLVAEWRSNILS